ncbi:hypothetical protein HDU89_000316 [Geranomyces variabilis]|nr:hypothetical protein HDU89_000316 [Geranomyces variabilis]
MSYDWQPWAAKAASNLCESAPDILHDELIKELLRLASKEKEIPKIAYKTMAAFVTKMKNETRAGPTISNVSVNAGPGSVIQIGERNTAEVPLQPAKGVYEAPTKVQQASLTVNEISGILGDLHDAVASFAGEFIQKHELILDRDAHGRFRNSRHKLPGKGGMTIDRQTWDLADVLHFISNNAASLAPPGISLFCGAQKAHPIPVINAVTADRHRWAHIAHLQGNKSMKKKRKPEVNCNWAPVVGINGGKAGPGPAIAFETRGEAGHAKAEYELDKLARMQEEEALQAKVAAAEGLVKIDQAKEAAAEAKRGTAKHALKAAKAERKLKHLTKKSKGKRRSDEDASVPTKKKHKRQSSANA